MRKKDSTIKITLQLPRNYFDKLDKVFEDEIAIAQKKWGILLKDFQKEKIYNNTKIQWSGKVNNVSKNPVDLVHNRVIFTVKTPKPMDDYLLPKKHQDNFPLMNLQTGWAVGKEDGKAFIFLNDFYDYMLEKLEQWFRTAVFYGVASYT